MTAAAKRTFPALDAVRFAAAAMVMLYHLCVATWAAPDSVTFAIVGGRARFPDLLTCTWFGFVGVEIFFVLSGFVIAYSAVDASPRSFAWARFVRLYPAAWICATTTAAVLILSGAEDTPKIVSGWKHSVALYPVGPWVDSVYWTLGVEMTFYASVFVVLLIGQRRHIDLFACGLGLIGAAYWMAGDFVCPRFLREHLWDRSLQLSMIPYGCFFALGIMLQSVIKGGRSLQRAGAILVMLSASMIEIRYKAEFNSARLGLALSALTPECVFVLSVSAIYLSAKLHVAASSAAALRSIGLMTYPLYLLHDHVGATVIRMSSDLGLNRYAALILAVGVCIAAGAWIARVAEPAVRRAIQAVGERLLGLSTAARTKVGASTKSLSPQA